MCRLYAMTANEEAKVECTLVHAQNALLLQSRQDLTGRTHSDGWGLAFYHNSHPEVERAVAAAYRDLHFSDTAERIYSKIVLAHVRLATVGEPVIENVHPFVCGHWAFVHNGTVRGFDLLQPEMLKETAERLRKFRRGSTDSEQLFLWLLSRLLDAGVDIERTDSDASVIAEMLSLSLNQLDQRCVVADPNRNSKLNIVLTDGRRLFATRWHNSLYFAERKAVDDCEICGIPHVHHDNSTDYRAVVIASEPISEEPWHEVPDQSLISVDRDAKMQIFSIMPRRLV